MLKRKRKPPHEKYYFEGSGAKVMDRHSVKERGLDYEVMVVQIRLIGVGDTEDIPSWAVGQRIMTRLSHVK